MISISRLLCDAIGPGDHLRYGHGSSLSEKPTDRPIVVWNCTRQCNLKCVHCYASATKERSCEEMDTEAGKALIRDIADFKAPVLLFSGGEPLIRRDLFELAEYAREMGLRVALSTNGTLLTQDAARRLKSLGFAEAGISLDGVGKNNDRFRGHEGAFDAALRGIRNCKSAGVRVSLRLTITQLNLGELPAIFKLVEDEGVDRVCIYHLAYSGRGSSLRDADISHEQTRRAVDLIMDRTIDLYSRGLPKEILTVSNHADGVYAYLKVKHSDPVRAARILSLLRVNGGNNSGMKISCVDDLGNVHADQFWWHYSVGNVKQRKFGDIWTDTSDPVMAGLKDRKGLLKGRCSRCKYLDLCNGNLRVRAEAVYGDVWAPDPACYLTDEEIGIES